MLFEELQKRNVTPMIPSVPKEQWQQVRDSYKNILMSEVYGRAVPEPEKLSFEIVKVDKKIAAGKATLYRIMAHAEIEGKPFSFPFMAVLPKDKGPYPFFIHHNFRDLMPDKYTPCEEIIDNGFALFSICYEDVTTDNDDFTNGLAGVLYPDGQRHNSDDPGKIMMWAWATRRVLDYAETLPCLDMSRAAVAGHSRLGKTALVTGMLDERFSYVCSNCAGCSGDAITRGKVGEHVSDIMQKFPFWFCPKYATYVDEEKLTFDQHLLLATIAPRTLLIGSAIEDSWADPYSQYLSCYAASAAWKNLGKTGLVGPDRAPVLGDNFDDGDICFHLRDYAHFFSRTDWIYYMNSIKKKWN